MDNNKNSSLASSNGQFQLISDDESLEDHSGLEDFQIHESDSVTPASPDYTFDQNPSTSDKMEMWNDSAILSSTSTCTVSNNKNHNGTNNSCCVNINSTTNSVPRISITPITPESPSILSQSLFQPKGYQGLPNSNSQSNHHYWRPQSPMPPTNEEEARDFFVFRESIIQSAIDDVQLLADQSIDGEVRGTWLFTEIDHFDMEKERIILLCSKSLIISKYNFIAMKQEEYRRISLCVVDKIIVGELVYPERSLTPRIGGVAGGLFGVVKDCIIPRVTGTVQTVGNVIYRNNKSPTVAESENAQENQVNAVDTKAEDNDSPKPPPSALSLGNFEPRTRNVHGVRILWDQNVPSNFTTQLKNFKNLWNPLSKSIPWITLASHPLLWHKGGGGGGISQSFDIDSFSRELIDILSHSSGGDSSPMCRVEYKSISIDSYLGLTSLFHNANGLGFYKVRGKLSF